MKSETIIRSRYTKRIETNTEPGRPMHNNYQIRINDRGHKELYKIGEHNLQAEINAAAEECDIAKILEKYKGGDIEALNKAQAGYVDLTKCPKDLREAQDVVLNLQSEFIKLPLEIRQKFDHSPEKYIKEYGNKYWQDAMGITKWKDDQAKKAALIEEQKKVNEADNNKGGEK